MTRVLLVEDCPDVLLLLKTELECSGYQVDALLDARKALGLAQMKRPDVIVSDLTMPEMDGLEFIKRVRQTPSLAGVPAIALTGSSLKREVQTAIASGFTLHVTKPVDGNVLRGHIEQLTIRRLHRKAG